MKPEFSRPERLDAIGEGERVVAVEADAAERAALAARFGLVAVERLAATFRVRRMGAGVAADGRVAARVIQACSVTGDPVPAAVDEAVALRFARERATAATTDEGKPGEIGPAEIELHRDSLDTLPIEGDAIDLGEAAAETMALALDPFPRAPGAAAALRAAGVVAEDEVRPVSGLAGLGRLLGGK